MRAAVLGSPIAHSRSPALHRAAYAALGLPWTYDAIEMTPDRLPDWLDGLGEDWAGLSLTMPLKEAVLALLHQVEPLATCVQAANTVVLEQGRRVGYNTDVHGMVAALAEAGITTVRHAVVLGGGATARSALAALARLGERAPTLVVRRTPTATLRTAERLGVTPGVVAWAPGGLPSDQLSGELAAADLLVSTLPAGVADPLAHQAAGVLATVPALLDVIYSPWPTPLARACGGTVVGGAAMLLHQAAAQVGLMTGRPPPLEAMRAALQG